jgi:hypothetical protein
MIRLLRIGPVALLAFLIGAVHAADVKPAGIVEPSFPGVKQANAAEPGYVITNPIRILSLAGLSATRERPLFSASRRPPAPPTPAVEPIRVAVPPPPLLPPTISLVGIVSGQEGAVAVIRTAANEVLRLRIGNGVGGWNVEDIGETRLTLSRDTRIVSFELFKSTRSRPAGGQNSPPAPRDAPSVAVVRNMATPAAPNMATAVVAPALALAPNIPPMGSNLAPPMVANIPNVPTFHDRFWRGPRQIEAE